MLSELGIFFAALGITTLELVEASAVALTLYAHSRRHLVFLYTAFGVAVVFAPMFVVGALIDLLPDYVVRLAAGALLLYFGIRLATSARRAVLNSRRGATFQEHFEKGTLAAAFSVGSVEAFEAAIVLVGLLPNGFDPTVLGMAGGIVVVVASTFALRGHVRKVKQARMKGVVSGLLLAFAAFWFGEAVTPLNDLLLVPLFVFCASAVYWFSNRPSPQRAEPQA